MTRSSANCLPSLAVCVCSVWTPAILAAAGLLALAAPTCASEASADPAAAAIDESRVLAAFTARFKAQNPGTRVDSVSIAPIAGLYEVVMGKNVAYTDASGRYALFGHVWDMQAHRDLTADRKAALDLVDVAALPRELALRHVRGRGTRTLYVFADPQCGYCKQLEQALQGLEDATIYTFVVPILGPESRRLATAIACATDPSASWSAWMLRGQLPIALGAPGAPAAGSAAGCEGTTDAIEKLAKSLGVSGTPTLIAGDGRKHVSALPTAQLSAWLGVAGIDASAQAGSVTGKNGPGSSDGIAMKATGR